MIVELETISLNMLRSRSEGEGIFLGRENNKCTELSSKLSTEIDGSDHRPFFKNFSVTVNANKRSFEKE